MEKLLEKMNYKGQSPILLVNLPTELKAFGALLAENAQLALSVDETENVEYAMFFVRRQAEIDAIAAQIQSKIKGDAILWFMYPKGTSKRYKCDFNRDTGWASLGQLGLEGVRMIAVNEDWSALRFRRVEYIKTFTRNDKMILSEAGKKRKG